MLAPNDVVPRVVGHLVGADQIAPPDLGRIEAEAGGALVHQPLADEIALGPPGRPERARRRLVGDDRPEIAVVAGHAIRAGEERGAELGRHEGRRAHVRADVRADQRAQPDDAPAPRRSRSRPGTRPARAWFVDIMASRRSSIHRTGRPSFIAASGTRMSSGYSSPRTPKPPPTSTSVRRRAPTGCRRSGPGCCG